MQNKKLKVAGTCGHFYLTEYAEPLTYRVRRMTARERRQLAAQFLELTHQLDSIYLVNEKFMIGKSETQQAASSLSSSAWPVPIQMCDMKLDNFGVSENGHLKIIDTDMAITDLYVFHGKVCSEHEDCHFFDCKSFCDPQAKKCIGRRVNNNLQSLCEKIFNNTWNVEDGVLSGLMMTMLGENIRYEMKRRLSNCQQPGFYLNSSNVVKGADKNLINVFRRLLSDKGPVEPDFERSPLGRLKD